jgi:hypothetical protein
MKQCAKIVTLMTLLFSNTGHPSPLLADQQNTIRADNYDGSSGIAIGFQLARVRLEFTEAFPWRSLLTERTSYYIRALKAAGNLYHYNLLGQCLEAMLTTQNSISEPKRVM